jgi:hypothetical protein
MMNYVGWLVGLLVGWSSFAAGKEFWASLDKLKRIIFFN